MTGAAYCSWRTRYWLGLASFLSSMWLALVLFTALQMSHEMADSSWRAYSDRAFVYSMALLLEALMLVAGVGVCAYFAVPAIGERMERRALLSAQMPAMNESML